MSVKCNGSTGFKVDSLSFFCTKYHNVKDILSTEPHHLDYSLGSTHSFKIQ